MAIPKFEPLAKASDGTKKIVKPFLIVVAAILLGAFGLEVTNNDFDLGKMLGGSSLEDSKVARDTSGNIIYDEDGNVTTDATKGKGADEYNCEDFETQPKAQTFFRRVGGTGNDLNRLDADKDGEACEHLAETQ